MNHSANGDNGAHGLRVEVPNALSGLMLVEQLGSACSLDGSDSEGWVVSGSANGNLSSTLATIHRWLDEEAIDRVTIHLGAHTHSMTRD
jgi:hypothetical protein